MRPGTRPASGSHAVDGPELPVEESHSPAARRRSSVTTRALALAVVFLILTISFASSLRIYVSQKQQIAATQQEIRDSQLRIADLDNQLAQWSDPAYVKTEARTRLGWVLPGEVGYRVVDQNAQATAGSPPVGAGGTAAPTNVWWQKLWGSVETADDPAPARPAAAPTKIPTITPSTTPKATTTPR